MPTYLAFLRAINLGPTRKFPANAVRAATEAAGGREVVTYLNTGNVRLDSARRSAPLLQRDLEAAYAADRGFAVPTIVFTRPEVRAIAARGRELEDEHGPNGNHYVTLYAGEPPAATVQALTVLEAPGEQSVVHGRAAHVLLDRGVSDSILLRSKEFRALGEWTARTLRVLETIVERWC